MSRTTFEEAKCCPRCDRPGEVTSEHPGERDSKVHVIHCRTEGCKWEDSAWIVQVMKDGSIPLRKPGEKDFTPLTETQKQHARDNLRRHEQVMRKGEIELPGR